MHQLKIHHQDDLVAAKGLFEMPSEYLKPFFYVNSLALRHCTELCFLPFNNRTIPHLKNKENRKSLLLFFVKKKKEKKKNNVNEKSSFCIRLWQLFKHFSFCILQILYELLS